MKTKMFICLVIAVCLLLAAMPVQALGTELDCSGFVANEEHRMYINTMMQYYLTAHSELTNALSNGKSVVFMFEGGSDNYPGNGYSDSGSNVRNQAVAIVVKNVAGKNQIVFYEENCSSIPSQPQDTAGGAYDRQTTICDGIYRIQTCNHTTQKGKVCYGALNIITNKGYYTPSSNKDGWENAADGINIHTRSSNTAGYGDGAWSWGCQLLGNGNNSGNSFNSFMKAVTGIDYNVWISYSAKQFNTVSSNIDVGYYVLDRQLAYEGLKQMYTETALNNITAFSRNAKNDAENNYLAKCTYLPSFCDIRIDKYSTTIKSLPCSKSTNSESADIEKAYKACTTQQ